MGENITSNSELRAKLSDNVDVDSGNSNISPNDAKTVNVNDKATMVNCADVLRFYITN